jgi:hypothetical protein
MTQSPDAYPGRPNVPGISLLASAARTETGTGDPVTLEGYLALVLQLDVTAAATDVGDTLDVYVQTTLDGGTNWVDIYHFTQVLGNGGAKRYFGKVVADASLTEFENATALGAAAGRAIFGSAYRVRWAITDASTDNASFTFSVSANAT